MKRSIRILSLLAAVFTALTAGAQEVSLFAITKILYHEQTDAATATFWGASFDGIIEGEDLSGSYPSGPRTITPPGKTARNFSFNDDDWSFYAEFDTQSQLDAAFPNGTYAVRMGGVTTSLNLTGNAYPNIPRATAESGQWVNGKLRLTAAEAAAGARIVSNTSTGNGFETFFLSGENRDYFFNVSIMQGQQSLEANIPPGALEVGGEYFVSMQFDQVTHTVSANAVDFGAMAYALYSVTTEFEIEVVADSVPRPELSFTYARDPNGLLIPTLRWTSANTQAWQVQYTEDFSGWTNLQAAVTSQVGANAITLPSSPAKARFFQLKTP